MAYFQSNEPVQQEDEQNVIEDEVQGAYYYSGSEAEDFEDGFNGESPQDEDGELSDEESRNLYESRVKTFFAAGNLISIVSGTILILLLLMLLFSMINFLMNDLSRNLLLFQTKF